MRGVQNLLLAQSQGMQRNAKYIPKLVSETAFKGPSEKHLRFKGSGLGEGREGGRSGGVCAMQTEMGAEIHL